MDIRSKTIYELVDAALLTGLTAFLLVYFDVRYLFYDTVVTGGDTASWMGIAHHLKDVLLPNGRLMGWDMGNFCGYPNFNFYFLPPFLLAALPSVLFGFPLTITLKWAIMSGIFFLPVSAYFGLRFMNYRFPAPVIGAAGAVLFLFNETYTMFGANNLSTFAGEFCYMFAFSLFVLFIGTFYKGTKENRWMVGNGLLLGGIGLSHLFMFIPALVLPIYAYLNGTRIRYLAGVGIIAFICMAFWILPLIAYRHPYTTPVYMIWQEFVNLRYSLAGLLVLIVLTAPRFAMHAVGRQDKKGVLPKIAFLFFSVAAAFAAVYLIGNYLVYGSDLWSTGLHYPEPSGAMIGKNFASKLQPLLLPISFGAGAAVAMFVGFLFYRGAYFRFCTAFGSLCFAAAVFIGASGLHGFVTDKILNTALKKQLSSSWFTVGVYGSLCVGILAYFILSKRFQERFKHCARQVPADRLFLWIVLIAGCATAYFSAHFLDVPDIRFLPPLGFALLMVFAVDTLEPFVAEKGKWFRIFFGFSICYVAVVAVIFGAVKSGNWYRFNKRGYEMTSGYPQFAQINRYLKNAYEKDGLTPLNAPRVGYEKCDLYGSFGGDRVFESLPFFSGRQTLEGIHYAGSIASRFTAFIQTEFSRDIKTPKPQILSKINPEALPVHFDLYNISHLVVMTDTVKKALAESPWFTKEVQFGIAEVYRYTGCRGKYVDVPDFRPVRYTGEKWVDDFFLWYKYPEINDVLLVPDRYLTDRADRAVVFDSTDRVLDIGRFRSNRLDRSGLVIDADIDHLRVRFTTNRLGVPHLIKVSYFPNWKVEGANGVYPVSPHLMMVIPRKNTVTLTYEQSAWETAGLAVSSIGLFLILAAAFMRYLKKAWSIRGNPVLSGKWERLLSEVEKCAAAARPYVFCLVMVSAVFLIAAGAALRNIPVRTYIAGYHLYKEGNLNRDRKNFAAADSAFRKAVLTMKPLLDARSQYDHRDVINCILTTATCHENLDEAEAAENWYLNLLSDYPYSRYVAEADVKLARIYRNRAYAGVATGKDRLQDPRHIEEALYWMDKSLSRYRNALEEDRFSVWAKYAVDDLKAEQQRMEEWTQVVLSLSNDEKTKNHVVLLSTIVTELLNRKI